MLKNNAKKHENIKYEAYYSMELEEMKAKMKNLLLMKRGQEDDEGKYHIWSSRSDDDEIRQPTH